MKILIVENIPQFGGGCETMSLQMGRELHERGHEIYLAHESSGSMLEAYSTFAKEILRIPLTLFSWRNMNGTFISVRGMARAVQRHDIDVIFTSHLGHLRGLSLLKKFYSIPSVFYLGLPPYDLQQPNVKKLDWSMKLAVKDILAGVACSNWIAEMWRQAGWPSESMYVVPHWIDTEKFKPVVDKIELRNRLNLTASTQIILYMGRVVENKGVEVLLKAFSKIQLQAPNTELVIAGPVAPDYQIHLHSIGAKLQIHPRLTIVGAVSNAADYFAAADLVVVPSIVEEAFGIVAIEAMACGTVTVVSSSGELPSVVGNKYRDLVFESGNSEDLADKVVSWLREPQKMVRRAEDLRQHTVLNYTQQGKLDVYERIMESACGQS